ncbi:MAG: alpha-galactosidase, partial [Lentisphaerae bacterium]|nr:alpha-galactosidase [Lentisphaerota bacterium]
MIRLCWPLMPDSATLYAEKEIIHFPGTQKEKTASGVTLGIETESSSLQIHVTADQTPLRYLSLRWNRKLPENARFLGDAWERTYGDIGWRTYDASRFMPWYFLMDSDGAIDCFGVMVRPSALVAWTADCEGVTLWLDLRCGGCGVVLNNRKLTVATVLFHHSEDKPFLAAGEFCRKMCPEPLLPPFPVYGGNNWYYAYGETSAEDIMRDCKYLASLT